MPVDFVTIPPDFSPAYIPLPFVISTGLFPNIVPGESGITVTSIGYPTLAELGANPALEVDDILVRHFTIGSTGAGDWVLISGTTLYNGTFRIVKDISPTLCVIETAYKGNDTGGVLSKYYRNLRVMVQVKIDGSNFSDPYCLTPDANGQVIIDVRKLCQDNLSLSILALNAGAITIAGTDGTCTVECDAWEAYDIPGSDGIPVFTEDTDGIKSSSVLTIVNADQPYYFDLPGQTYKFDDKLVDYMHIGATLSRRFMTHMPRGVDIPIARDENVRLDWLQGLTGGTRTIRIRTYNGAGTLIATWDTSFVASVKKTYGIQCGPADLDPLWITSDTVRYTVQILESLTSLQLSEVVTFRLDPVNCDGPRVRFHWRNRLGALDSFTFNGTEIDEGASSSRITATDALYGKANTIRHIRRARSRVSAHDLTIATDHIPQEFMQWLQHELCESPEVYITKPGYPKYVPVLMANGSPQAWDTRTSRGTFSVTYSLSNETPHQRVA